MNPPVVIPHTSSPKQSAKFLLCQPWQKISAPQFLPAHVHLRWSEDALYVQADLEDANVLTTATADNQNLWELGDTFEMFFQIEGHNSYTELHVAPNGIRLHLRFPDKCHVSPPAFTASTNIAPPGWFVLARIPANTLDLPHFQSSQILRASFCRYDASPHLPPILSTTSSHPLIAFHRPHEWTPIQLEK